MRISSNHFDNKTEQFIPKQGKGLELTRTQHNNNNNDDIETANTNNNTNTNTNGNNVFKLVNTPTSSVRKGVRNDISWQQKLSKINFESDSDSDDDDDNDNEKKSKKKVSTKNTNTNKGKGGNKLQTIELYSNHFPQINTNSDRKKDRAEHKYDPKRSHNTNTNTIATKASSGAIYAQLGNDSDDDDDDNETEVINPFYNS